ncbi:ABC transporter permease [Luteococcus sediminum]
MIQALNSERIKFFSTRGWLIGLASFVALALLLPVANAMSATQPLQTQGAYAGILGFAMMAAMVVAAAQVTQEYRFRMIQLTHQAAPQRWQPLLAKAAIGALFGAVLSVIMSVVVALTANALVEPELRAVFELAAQASTIATTALTVAIMCVFAVGLGALVRSTPAAVALIVLWQTPIELVLGMLPGIGKHLHPYLLFNNTMQAALGTTPPQVHLEWGQTGALGYLATIALVTLCLGWMRSRQPASE